MSLQGYSNFEFFSEDKFEIFAIKKYDNPTCTGLDEFNRDLKRFRYINRLFTEFKIDNNLRSNLIINHIIILYNLFGENATIMLFHRIEKDHWSILSSFLIFLNRLPANVSFEDITIFKSDELKNDISIIKELNQL